MRDETEPIDATGHPNHTTDQHDDAIDNVATALGQTYTLPTVEHVLTEGIAMIPALSRVRVLRQWAGCYDVTPDNSPILGRTPGLENLLQMSGFVGHGFMMAPANPSCAHARNAASTSGTSSLTTMSRKLPAA